MMEKLWKTLMAIVAVAVLPSVAFAQGSIAGTVKDTSGAVLPGVTVEAASPALIEKTRSVVTDGTGQYKIVDLRPGTYSVTFTLPGFATVKREAIELSGSFTATINADMKVGELEETITVTGDTPIVDVQSTTKERVLGHDQIDALPTGRLYAQLGSLVPGVTSNQVDVGGSAGDNMASLTAHGSKTVDMRVTQNGVTTATLQAGGGIGMATPNVNAAQEVTVDSAGVDASLSTGGPRINFIPRDGGNVFKSSIFANATGHALQGDNLSDDLIARGLNAADSVKTIYDINPGVGGPIKKDKIWFWYTGRWNHSDNYVGGMFFNQNANNPDAFTYVADPSQQAFNNIHQTDNQIRLTVQATPRNKFAGTWDQQTRCNCPFYISATRSPEAGNDRRSPTQRLLHAEWTSPVTSRLLLEAVGLHRTERWGNMPPTLEGFVSGAAPGVAGIVDQGGPIPGLQYRSGGTGIGTYNNTWVPNYFYRAALSYVTGAHAFKAGFNDAIGYLQSTTYNYTPLMYRFNNGVPNQLTEFATPIPTKQDQNHDLGIYAQDKWTLKRLTLSGGLRFDYFNSSFPVQTIGPSPLTPNRNLTFPETPDLDWKDIEPRMGAVYDLFGSGKTALRVSVNKYLQGQGLNGLGSSPNPINTLQNSTTRTWNDINRNFTPDCDLVNPAANGECLKIDSPLFGSTNAAQTFDPNLLGGWGHRNYNWEFSGGVQHELLPRLSIDVAYFRRIFGNFQVTDSLAVTPASFQQFSVTAPMDSRLPGGGGYTVNGLYNILPQFVGLNTTQIFNTLNQGGSGPITDYGRQIDHWNGFDITTNARFRNGLLFQGGVSIGRETTDNCDIVAQVPEMLVGTTGAPNASNTVTTGTTNPAAQFCHQQEPWLTQVKVSGSYMVPRIAVRVSGTYQNAPGTAIVANFVANNAFLNNSANSTLGRNLASGTNATIGLIEPLTQYGERLNQLDLRFGKMLKFGRTSTSVNVDLYNALNANTVLTLQNTYNPTVLSGTGSWQQPLSILTARFIKFGVQFDF